MSLGQRGHVHEADAVREAVGGVPEPVGRALAQLGVDALDQAPVLLGPAWLHPVANDHFTHRDLLSGVECDADGNIKVTRLMKIQVIAESAVTPCGPVGATRFLLATAGNLTSMTGHSRTAEPFLPDRRSLTSCAPPPRRAAAATSGSGRPRRCSAKARRGRSRARRRGAGRSRGPRRAPVRRSGRAASWTRGSSAAGIDRDRAYVTNAVKHFKWEERGKRRIHQTPSRWEIVACAPWLAAELAAVRPDVLVLMGRVAATSVMGAAFRVTRERGRVLGRARRHCRRLPRCIRRRSCAAHRRP